jgi:hypothetical protein
MHDPDERPCLRWRMLAWGIAGLLLTPVLYVAIVGPIGWWERWHPWHMPRFGDYYRSLEPIYQSSPQFRQTYHVYHA